MGSSKTIMCHRLVSVQPAVYGPVPTPALTDVRAPLVVTRLDACDELGFSYKRWYTVTHVASGMKVGQWKRLTDAKSALVKLLPLIDWTKARGEIRPSDRVLRRIRSILEQTHGY